MKSERMPLFKLFFVLLLLVPVVACNNGEESTVGEKGEATEASYTEEEPKAVTETEELKPVEVPEFDEGLITYFTGNVYILDGQEWWDVAIGDFVKKGDVIKTEMESYCEIQFGETAVVKIQENTEMSMETLSLESENANVALNMKSGAVLAKVQKLTGNEQFRVKTQTAVCGVRGTEFGVSSTADMKTKVAVKEGSVSVLPSNMDVDRLKEKVATKGEDVQKLIDTIEETAPVVEANQEIEVAEEDVKKSEKTAKEIEKAVDDIAQDEAPEVQSEKIAALTKTIEEKKTEVSQTVKPAKAISAESTEELKALEAMEVLEIPVAQKTGKPSEEKEEPEKKEPELVKLSLVVVPEDAMIEVNGSPEGRGKFSRIYSYGKNVSFRITRTGYAPHSMVITTSPDTQKEYKVTLAKLPEPEPVIEKITVDAEPNDAEIFLNGSRVGKGRFSDEYEAGESLSFSIRRDGYEEEKLNINVREGSGRTYNVTLNKDQEEIGVQTYPGDAAIYLDESKVGEGNYKDKFEVGKKLTFKVEKEGYEPQTIEVDVKDGAGSIYDVSLTKKEAEKAEVKEEEIVVRTTPDDAVIYLNGDRVGRGSFSESFEYGENLDFSFQADGHEPAELSMTVQQGSGKIYSINLEPIIETITIRATPSDADIYLNGTRVGSGSYSDSYRTGEELTFSVRAAGYEHQTLSMTVTEGSGQTHNINLQPITERVVIRTTPRNATIFYNGREVGTGYFADEFPVGNDLNFTISEPGYKEENLSVSVEEGGDNTYSVGLEPMSERIAVSVTPSEAEIYLNGSRVGSGYYSDQFNHGRQLSFRIEEEGYKTENLDISVEAGAGKTYSVTLEPKMEQISLRTTPDDANIYLDGERVGNGSFSEEFRYGSQLTFIIRKEGYVDERLSFTVNEDTAKTYTISLEQEIITETVTIRTAPNDAKIIVNGSTMGTGRFSREYEAGERLSLRVEHDGYETATRTITVSANMDPITINLTQKTIQARIRLSGGQIVGNITTDGKNIYTANNYGVVSAVTMSGQKIWSINSKNSPNENSYPVLIDDTIFFSGSRELIIADAEDGSIVNREDLGGSSAHLFGRRTVDYDSSTVLFPTNDTINMIAKNSGSTVDKVAIPKGSRMTPGVWGSNIVIVDQQGSLVVIDPEAGNPVQVSIATSAVQPVALGVTVYRDKAFFSGRKGTIVCTDLNLKRVLWEEKLPGNASVFTDVQVGPAGAYVFSKGTIYGLSMLDGSKLFTPITGVTSPPLYENNKLYYGTPKEVVVRNASNGTVERIINIDEQTTARPVMTSSGKLIVGTKKGEGFIINP